MTFAYTKVANAPPRPYLDVIPRNGFSTTPKLMALVDSGADYPLFPTEIAQYLKLDLGRARKWQFSGTTGILQEARLADLSLSMVKESDGGQAFEVMSTCAFCDTFKFPAALLGQIGFFSLFKTTFCQPQNYFEIVPWEDTISHR